MSNGNDDKTKEVQRLANLIYNYAYHSWVYYVVSLAPTLASIIAFNKTQRSEFLQMYFASQFLEASRVERIKFLDEEQKQQVYETARAEFEQLLVANRLMP